MEISEKDLDGANAGETERVENNGSVIELGESDNANGVRLSSGCESAAEERNTMLLKRIGRE